MSYNKDDKIYKVHNLKKIVELLKLALSIDDKELLKSTIESIIDMLEEEIN
jgi:Asp-tRNA(Asn)/Glu-tRNA(Gln) amidotransferase C subunit